MMMMMQVVMICLRCCYGDDDGRYGMCSITPHSRYHTHGDDDGR